VERQAPGTGPGPDLLSVFTYLISQEDPSGTSRKEVTAVSLRRVRDLAAEDVGI
jgi:hypothetical protein